MLQINSIISTLTDLLVYLADSHDSQNVVALTLNGGPEDPFDRPPTRLWIYPEHFPGLYH
jgi:hypothetical protein